MNNTNNVFIILMKTEPKRRGFDPKVEILKLFVTRRGAERCFKGLKGGGYVKYQLREGLGPIEPHTLWV